MSKVLLLLLAIWLTISLMQVARARVRDWRHSRYVIASVPRGRRMNPEQICDLVLRRYPRAQTFLIRRAIKRLCEKGRFTSEEFSQFGLPRGPYIRIG